MHTPCAPHAHTLRIPAHTPCRHAAHTLRARCTLCTLRTFVQTSANLCTLCTLCTPPASVLQALGRYTEAEPLLLEASKIQGRTLGADHPHTVASLSNLATVYEAMGQAERAAAMHSLVAVHKKTYEEKQRQAAKRR